MLKSYLAFTSAVHHVLTRAYERLGAAIARKPLLTILLSIGAISLANLGLLKLRTKVLPLRISLRSTKA